MLQVTGEALGTSEKSGLRSIEKSPEYGNSGVRSVLPSLVPKPSASPVTCTLDFPLEMTARAV